MIKVSSTPAADLFMVDSRMNAQKKVGQTPIEIKPGDLAGDKNFLILKFTKEGYEPFQIVMPKDWSQGELNIKLVEKEKFASEELKKQVRTEVSKITVQQIMSVLLVQKSLMQKKYQEALSHITQLRTLEAPNSVIALLMGNLSYLQSNKARALAHYKIALAADPGNVDLRQVISLLEDQEPSSKGQRRPSGRSRK